MCRNKYSNDIFIITLVFFMGCSASLYSTNIDSTLSIDTSKKVSYPVIIQDSPSKLFTMRQFNQNYLSAYRYLSTELLDNVPVKTSLFIQAIATLITNPLTHEEGHRSILTSLGIGSISQPYYNLQGAAYVNGVTDVTLQNLRDNNLPTYVRLHTAGLESDYMLTNRMEELIVFDFDERRYMYVDYFIRKTSMVGYYLLGMAPKLNIELQEEKNELKRDIVGNDVYGAVKNLFRPDIPFYRYTNYDDLTKEEKKFVTRAGYRSLLNLASPMFFKPLRFIRKENAKLSVSLGYTMCPFGDFIDENIYLQLYKKYNVHIYFRQFENKNMWFPAGGVSLVNYQITPKFNTTLSAQLWSQPKQMDFNTSESQFGGSGDVLLKYIFLSTHSGNAISIDAGVNYKTYGFLPEEVIMGEHWGVRWGTTIYLNRK